MSGPRVEIDLVKVEHNARQLARLCRRAGVEAVGVTKACRGMPEVGRAMLAGGVEVLADSRSTVEDVVELADVSLNSELATLERLSAAARTSGRRHRVIIMVELGDLREGFLPEEAIAALGEQDVAAKALTRELPPYLAKVFISGGSSQACSWGCGNGGCSHLLSFASSSHHRAGGGRP